MLAGSRANAVVPEALHVQRVICHWEFLPVQNLPQPPDFRSIGEGLEPCAKSSLSFLCNRPFLMVHWKWYQTQLTKCTCTATCVCVHRPTPQVGHSPHKSASALSCSNIISLLAVPVEKALPWPECFVLPPLCRLEEMCAHPAGQIQV